MTTNQNGTTEQAPQADTAEPVHLGSVVSDLVNKLTPVAMAVVPSLLGGGSGDGIDTDSIMKILSPELYDEDVEPLFSKGSATGSVMSAPGKPTTMGVMSVDLIPPTMISTRATLRLNLNGTLLVNPTQLAELGNWLSEVAQSTIMVADGKGGFTKKTLTEQYEAAMQLQDEYAEKRREASLGGIIGKFLN